MFLHVSGVIAVVPSGQNRQKSSLKESVFVVLALKLQCHVKNTLLRSGNQ